MILSSHFPQRAILNEAAAAAEFDRRAQQITQMGNICSSWKAESRTLRSLYRPWTIGTCPTSVCPDLSWLRRPFYAACYPENMQQYQQRMARKRTGRWPYRWTAGKRGRLEFKRMVKRWAITIKGGIPSYPSCFCVDWAKAINGSVLIEVLWHREPQEDGES